MGKYLFIILTATLLSTFSYAEDETINECMNDIYFANGINTNRDEAKIQLDDLIEPNVSNNAMNVEFIG